VVLDTNVLLSAAFFPGVCEKLPAHCFLTPSVRLVLSENILDEFVQHGLGKLNGTANQIDAAVAELRRRCRIVAPASLPVDTISDVDDLPVLGAAIAGQADCLITGDQELLNLGSWGNSPVKGDDPGSRFPGRGSLGRREQPVHEPLNSRATLTEVPLTGLYPLCADRELIGKGIKSIL
jgi:putative PIN family toxin of toxin-antitoxin system